MGVLDTVWYGEYTRRADGRRLPLIRHARLADLPELDPADWWEVPDTGPLARRIRRYYPSMRPVVGEAGELLDVAVSASPEQAKAKAGLDAEASRRGYRYRGKVRPKMLFPSLSANP